MVTRSFVILSCAALFATWTEGARAAEPQAQPAPVAAPPAATDSGAAPSSASEPPPAQVPRLHHAPPAVVPAHGVYEIQASIDFPHLLRRTVVVYRALRRFDQRGEAAWAKIDFSRSPDGPVSASIPAGVARSPGFEYFIELEFVDGHREEAFASRQTPHRVAVSEDLMDVRERAALERLEGRRSLASVSGDYVDFGKSSVRETTGEVVDVPDRYYRIEGAFAYRLLRTVDEFGLRVGVLRGDSPRREETARDVGYYYAAPSTRLRLAELWQGEAAVLAGLTEEGFALGIGGAVHVGDPHGSKLRLGFEYVDGFGGRIFTQVDIQATSRLRLSPIVEATNMPHADRFGVRLLGEAAYQVGGGFAVGVSGGYQARDATSGGPSAGLRLMQAF